MSAHCYILYSEKLRKFYIGASQDIVEKRIQKHNTAFYGLTKFTAKANDWVLFLKIEAVDYSHAIRMERKIKSMKSSKYIQNLKKYPEIVEKITSETQKNT